MWPLLWKQMFWQFACVEHSVACYHKTPAMILKMFLLLPINLGIVIKAISTNLKSIILQQERGFKSGKYSGQLSIFTGRPRKIIISSVLTEWPKTQELQIRFFRLQLTFKMLKFKRVQFTKDWTSIAFLEILLGEKSAAVCKVAP